MGAIFSLLIFSLFISFFPVFLAGLLFKGWKPWWMSAVLLAIFILLSSRIAFHPIASLFHYFVVLAIYVMGGKIRTGKSTEEALGAPVKDEI